jgi:dimethylhistidine N-methyltransferase
MPSAEIAAISANTLASDVRQGLTSSPKSINPRNFYDELGSALFAAICELPEYYVTRAEREILGRYAGDIALSFGTPLGRIIELGSGNARKTRRIIDAVLAKQSRLLYQPIDVDAEMLETSRRELSAEFPALEVRGLQADFSDLAAAGASEDRSVVLFLGSSIGNLDHAAAASLLRNVRKILHAGDHLFVGFDLRKPVAVLESAYNDALGVTASFNLNVLARINRELGGNFRLDRFTHRAFFNDGESRIEMHLVSNEAQSVRIESLGMDVSFERGESIHTENSYKYDDASIEAMASSAGLQAERRWTDPHGWFADVLFAV